MKAKELATILLMNPEAEVLHYQYMGGDTPLVELNTAVFEKKGEKTIANDDGGVFIKNGIAKLDIIILKYDPNKK